MGYSAEVAVKYDFMIGETRLDITKSGPKAWYTEWVRTRKKQFSREDGWVGEMQNPEHLGEATWQDIFLSEPPVRPSFSCLLIS